MTRLPAEEIRAMQKLVELEWQRRYFIPLFLQLGWSGHHETDSRKSRTRSATGDNEALLDWLLWRERILFVELKKEGGYLTEGQRRTIGGLQKAGADVAVYYPRMWTNIVKELQRWEPTQETA